MNTRFTVGLALLCLLFAGFISTAHAGRNCEARLPSAASVQRSLDLAQRTAERLDASGAQVVMLARAGQNLSRYGLRYSHLGFAYRESPSQGEGMPAVWRVVHKLNHCGTAHGALYRQGLGEFFLDDLHDYEAGVVVLNADVQAALIDLLRDNRRSAALHTPAYNMLAYPWAQTYQQSNQWAIETLALAGDSAATTRERAQAWLKLQGYEPTTLRLSAFTRLGARATQAHIAFDDHPNDKRFRDRIETVTVDSVFAWLARSHLGAPAIAIRWVGARPAPHRRPAGTDPGTQRLPSARCAQTHGGRARRRHRARRGSR
jgi:hypothetical protein